MDHGPKYHYISVLNISRDDDFTTSLGSPFQYLTTPPEKLVLMSNLNVPWHNSHPVTGCLGG